MENDNQIKRFWLYVLKQEQDKYYVGVTARTNPSDRIRQHISGYYGAKWTKQYPPIMEMECVDLGCMTFAEAEKIELQKTREYMKRYGYNNVRGGKLSYSGKYVKIGGLFFTKDEFLNLITVLIMMGCVLGLYLIARQHR